MFALIKVHPEFQYSKNGNNYVLNICVSENKSILEQIIEDIKTLNNCPSRDSILIQSEIGRKYLENEVLIKHYEELRDKTDPGSTKRQSYKDKAKFYRNLRDGFSRWIEEEKILENYKNQYTKKCT